MTDSSELILTGTRDSQLSLAQTRQAIKQINEVFPELRFDIVPMSSPGDRDKCTDLRLTPEDFFTRDLDEAVISGRITCALHSAKDLPEQISAGIDLLYLPWTEDSRDVLILRKGQSAVLPKPRIGVSSARRENYCRKRFPEAVMKSIRGNIEHRIKQLDNGDYDLLIMAAAGLNRLGLAERISEYIPLTELTPPDGQGKLALTFREGDKRFLRIRSLFAYPVIFAGAGTGTIDNATKGTIEALETADICFYDALCHPGLLEYLPAGAEKIPVGKRASKHSFEQEKISFMLADNARRNRKVVRLKGGDPGIFGRLAEETEMLDKYFLPYRALPGVSSLSAATSGTGFLLTRRGLSRGFTAVTPRRSGTGKIEWLSDEEKKSLPLVLFMASSELAQIAAQLKSDGYNEALPVSVVFDAGGEKEKILTGTLGGIDKLTFETQAPGIVIVGKTADCHFIFPHNGALNGMRILFTGSRGLQEKASRFIRRYDGCPVLRPMIHIDAVSSAFEILRHALTFDYLIISSPAAAELCLSAALENKIDLRRLPKLAVCGPGTEAVFVSHGIYPEICPAGDFGTNGLLDELKNRLNGRETLVRLSSSLAKPLAENIKDLVFYQNKNIHYDDMPEFDAVLFTSASSVGAFIENFSEKCLENKIIGAIGKPTADFLSALSIPLNVISGEQATLESLVYELARQNVNKKLNGDF